MKADSSRRLSDRRLIDAYHEANQLDEAGIEAICPLYFELSETETRYRDESFLAQGGSKEVSKVYDSRTKKWLAMARPRADLGPEHLDRFVHEAWLTSSLVHPNIINIYDAGVDTQGRPFFTMDLKSDRTLASHVVPGRAPEGWQPAGDRELLEIFVKICEAMAYAHSRGSLHLDLKPENIQVDRFGEVLVCDWGLGKRSGEEMPWDVGPISEELADRVGLTLNGEIKGTPGFMAPEQADPDEEKDERTDIFALGCILYAILTKAPVFTGKTPDEILEQTSKGEIIPPHLRFPDHKILPGLEAVAMKALALNPTERYDSVDDLRIEISRYLAGYTTSAENPGFCREIVSFVQRNQLASAVSVVALITLTVVSVLFIQGLQRQQELAKLERERAEEHRNRAQTLAETAENLTAQINSLDGARIDLADDIASACLDLNFGFLHDSAPLKTHDQVAQLAAVALAMNPENLTTRRLQFRLACHEMDFASASELLPIVGDHVPVNQAWIAKNFEDFAFNRNSRPSIDWLISFLEEIDEHTRPTREDTEPSAFLDTLLAYDVLARADPENYGPVIQAFLKFINPDWDTDGFLYNPESRSLTLRFGQPFRFDTYDASQPVLRHLNLRSLRLESHGANDLKTLDGLMIESLDLRSCPLELTDTIQLPELLELHVEAGQITSAELRAKIQSEKPLSIIEHTIGS